MNFTIELPRWEIKSSICIAAVVVMPTAFGWESSLKQTAETYYKSSCSLIAAQDVSGLSRLMTATMTSDYRKSQMPDSTGVVKTLTLSDYLAQLKHISPLMSKVIKSDTHIDKITITGSSATIILTSTSDMYAALVTRGPQHRLKGTSRSENHWIKVGSAWKLKSSKEIAFSSTMDGEPARR